MNFRSLFSNSQEERSALTFQDVWGTGASSPMATATGKSVTADSALSVTTVYGSVRILADNVATRPLDAFIRWDGVKSPYRPRPEWMKFHLGHLRKVDLLTQVMTSLLLDGNAYIATYRGPDARIMWMEVLDPAGVDTDLSDNGMSKEFLVEGSTYSSMDILHIPGMQMPGSIQGMSPISYARESIALSIAAQEYGATFFGNGTVPGGVVEIPGELSPEGASLLRQQWQSSHGGTGNSNKLAVLTAGAKFSKITINPEDAQFLETRAFQVSDIARVFGVPPHLLGDASGSTSWGSGLAEQNTAFVQQSLRPWVERIEAALTWVMWTEQHSREAFAKLSMDDMLRGDFSKSIDSYAKGITAGFFTPDEVRGFLDLPPLPEDYKPPATPEPAPEEEPEEPADDPDEETPDDDE